MGSEGQEISPLGGDQRSRLADSVTRRNFDPGKDRLITGLCMLQGGGELVAVKWHHAIIMISGEYQRRRIAGSGAYVVQRRVRERLGELLRVVRASVIRGPCGADREEMEAQQVQDTNSWQRGCR